MTHFCHQVLKPLHVGSYLQVLVFFFFWLHVLEPSIAAEGSNVITKDLVGKIISIFVLFCIFWFCLE